MEGRRNIGRLPLSKICYILAREMKHEPKLSRHTIAEKMHTLLIGSNEPGSG